MLLHSALILLVSTSIMAMVSGFGSTEDKFIKKYAMMKIYESCFGPEVIKQIRKEMKAACAKCAAFEAPSSPSIPPPIRQSQPLIPQIPQLPQIPSGFESKPDGISDPESTIYANQQAFDADKLQQAILAYRPNPFTVPSYRPYPAQNYYGGYSNPGYPGPLYYPSSYPQVSAIGSPYAAYPFFPAQPYLGTNRVSRDMDIRSQLESITSRVNGRVRNVTCVMQELGYLDENMEPSYAKISERIGNLPVPDELRKDMQDGVEFCQQFSQCVPEVKKENSPLSRELIRPMFFFKCYKHKKLEACIMKDVREKYAGVGEDDFDSEVEFRRTGKSTKFDEKEIDALANSMYEFLYGSDSSVDMDSLF